MTHLAQKQQTHTLRCFSHRRPEPGNRMLRYDDDSDELRNGPIEAPFFRDRAKQNEVGGESQSQHQSRF